MSTQTVPQHGSTPAPTQQQQGQTTTQPQQTGGTVAPPAPIIRDWASI